MINETLGQRARRLRDDLNLSQQQVAESLSVSQQAIATLEGDKSNPRYLRRLAKLYNVSEAYLEYGITDHNNSPIAASISDFSTNSNNIVLSSQNTPDKNHSLVQSPITGTCKAMRIETTDMHPRLRAGDIVFYNPENSSPSRGQECLIFKKDGLVLVREYEERVAQVVMTRLLHPITESDPIRTADIHMVCPIIARG